MSDRAEVVVVGYGNDLRRDDAIGRVVAEEVDRRRLPGVSVITATQLLPELVEPISRADRVVFVDGSLDASLDAGLVSVRPVSPRSSETSVPTSHRLGPEELLGLAEALGLAAPAAVVVEVPVWDVSLGVGLGDLARTRVPIAVERVIEQCVAAGHDRPDEFTGAR